jgi:prolyl-tRNA synthetase
MRMSHNLGRRWRGERTDAEAPSHELLLRAGYIRQHAAGIYSYLHFGLRSLRRIEAVVRQEMDRSGAQEILMPIVHSADVWRQTGRYDEVDETLVRFSDRRGREMVLAMTHEEIVAELAATDIRSYRDANVVVYQIQTKFRDELRPRGGLLRTREFIMKDAYSLHADEGGMTEAYQSQTEAYARIFQRLGLRDVHQIRSASGVMGGTLAHEFMCLLDSGEDRVVFCHHCGDAWNTEVTGDVSCTSCGNDGETRRGVEVGNIFQLGTRYTDSLGAQATGRDGTARSVVMGSYGIGISRLLATLVEQGHDERGIALTAASAPFDAHLVVLGPPAPLEETAQDIHSGCIAAGVQVLWDDRGLSAGQQLVDADLVGATVRVTVGRSALDADQVELRERRSGRVHLVASADAPAAIRSLIQDIQTHEEAVGG